MGLLARPNFKVAHGCLRLVFYIFLEEFATSYAS